MSQTTIDITARKTRTINLPSFPEAEIELGGDLTVGEIEEINKDISENETEAMAEERGMRMLVKAIVKWNLASPEGILPINKESLSLLPMKDYLFITQEVSGTKLLDKDNNIISAQQKIEETQGKQ